MKYLDQNDYDEDVIDVWVRTPNSTDPNIGIGNTVIDGGIVRFVVSKEATTYQTTLSWVRGVSMHPLPEYASFPDSHFFLARFSEQNEFAFNGFNVRGITQFSGKVGQYISSGVSASDYFYDVPGNFRFFRIYHVNDAPARYRVRFQGKI